jgi:hypothetical protein
MRRAVQVGRHRRERALGLLQLSPLDESSDECCRPEQSPERQG